MTALAGVEMIAERVARAAMPAQGVIGAVVTPMTDWLGDNGLDIRIILSDAAFDPERVGGHLPEIAANLRDALLAAGEDRFPYINFVGESDLAAA